MSCDYAGVKPCPSQSQIIPEAICDTGSRTLRACVFGLLFWQRSSGKTILERERRFAPVWREMRGFQPHAVGFLTVVAVLLEGNVDFLLIPIGLSSEIGIDIVGLVCDARCNPSEVSRRLAAGVGHDCRLNLADR